MKTVKTIWGYLIDNMKLLNTPINLPNYVTLNSKHGLPDISDTDIAKWSLNYFSIGLKPVNYIAGASHDCSDRDLYRPIPFVIKPKSIDLTAVELDSYRIKASKEVDLKDSNLLYLKKISNINFDSIVYHSKFNNNNNLFSLDNFTIPIEFTSPMIENRCEDEKDFLALSTVIKIRLSKAEIDVLKSNATLLYGETNPELFEVGLFGGIEDSNNNELVKTVAYLFKPITEFHYNEDGDMLIDINIGTMVPK